VSNNLRLTVAEEGSSFTLTVAGEIDLSNGHDLGSAVQRALVSGSFRFLTLDLDGVTFMDCTGLATLVEVNGECKRRAVALTIKNTPGCVRRIIELTKMWDVFPIMGAINMELPADPVTCRSPRQ
jgi:anti-sigma B factor antagonist/stage II sporulation protein AA (anti-sigma F factor antagonist)